MNSPESSKQKNNRQKCNRIDDGENFGVEVELVVNGQPVSAFLGESVLSVLFSLGMRAISKSDQGTVSGAYCGMGVCHCCLVQINGQEKQRACLAPVTDGMVIETQRTVKDALKTVPDKIAGADGGTK